MKQSDKATWRYLVSFPVVVAALGYFVDIYDLLLFGIVRVPSLHELGLNVDVVGTRIIGYQMTGLLLGGIGWGVMGDKKGRLSVLFGSILVYSIANVACGLLPYIPSQYAADTYAWLRFIAGIGLAGELGAGITLVSESLPVRVRALGTSVVAGFGLSGAVFAQLTVQWAGHWTTAYLIGGGMGLALLLLRVGVLESQLYHGVKTRAHVQKGHFLAFFTHKGRCLRYLRCILIGLPTWYCIGILVMMANQFAPALGIAQLDPGKAIMWAYIGISVGDLGSGFLSHALHSRRKAIAVLLAFTAIGVGYLLASGPNSAEMYYMVCAWMGLGTGYWALFVTVAAEQFGTNLRSTATTTIPNMVRGTVPLMLWIFDGLKPECGVLTAALWLGLPIFALGFWASWRMRETHNQSLDFLE